MKRIVLIFFAAIFLVVACKKDKNSIENPDGTIDVQKISLSTIEPVFKSDLSIKTGGKTSFDLSKHTYLEYGVCFGEDANPTINDNLSFTSVSNGGEYESIIDQKHIKLDKILYIRAYIKNINNGSVKYGNEVKTEKEYIPTEGDVIVSKISLTTIIPTVGEDNVVTTGGQANIDFNKYPQLEYGVCYGTSSSPTINNYIKYSENSSNGGFSSIIDGIYITTQTTYYIRAYVLNRSDNSVKYGNEVNVKLNPVVFDTKYVPGKYAGRHFLNIPDNILKALSESLPPDPVTGLPQDLTKGLADTLDFRIVNGVVKISSALFGVKLDGKLIASNTVKIEETKFDVLSFGPFVSAQNASLATNKEIKFTSSAIGSSTSVELRFKASKIGDLTIPLNITTTGTFTKIAN